MEALFKFLFCSIVLMVTSWSSVATASMDSAHIIGAFHIEQSASGLLITPYLKADKNIQLRYKVSVNKCGHAGISRHHNSGRVDLTANEEKSIGTKLTFPGFSDSDYVSMTLKVFQNKQLLTEFSRNYPENKGCELAGK